MVRIRNKENGGRTNSGERAMFACFVHVNVGPYNTYSRIHVMFSCLGEWSKKRKREEGTYLAPINLGWGEAGKKGKREGKVLP